MKKRYKLAIVLSVLGALAGGMTAMAADVQHTAVLGGVVTSVTPVGAVVKEGDVLLSVNALAGTIPVTRASVNGVVKAVMVHPGSNVQQGEVVVIVESK